MSNYEDLCPKERETPRPGGRPAGGVYGGGAGKGTKMLRVGAQRQAIRGPLSIDWIRETENVILFSAT